MQSCNEDRYVTRNFTNKELFCRCGCGFQPEPTAIMKLQELRDRLAAPMIINSGARCEMHNKKSGGSKNSQHMQGIAFDIKCLTNARRFDLIKLAIETGFKGIIIYEKFIHIDLREEVSLKVAYS